MNRNRAIIRTGVLGIAANLLLAAFKLTVGILSNSISIITDAVNNTTDAMSSVITIVGARLTEKEPDRRHPFGYGRVEHLSSLGIGIVILYAGFDALKNSVERIIHPEPNEYTAVTMLVVAAAVLVKLLIGHYTGKQGKMLDSQPLKASGRDAVNDSIASALTLTAAIIYITTGHSFEAWVGSIISLVIIKTGYDTLKDTADSILGKSAGPELSAVVRNCILSFPEVEGIYDIVIHSYGRDRLLGSAHVEVSDRYKVAWVDNLQRSVTRRVKEDTGVEMLGLSVYAINTHSEYAITARETVRSIVSVCDGVGQMHGFYIDPVDKVMNFDVVVEFSVGSVESVRDDMKRKVLEIYPEYDVRITIDRDYTQ